MSDRHRITTKLAEISLSAPSFCNRFTVAFLFGHQLLVIHQPPGAKVAPVNSRLNSAVRFAQMTTIVETAALRQSFDILEQRRDPGFTITQLQLADPRTVDQQAAFRKKVHTARCRRMTPSGVIFTNSSGFLYRSATQAIKQGRLPDPRRARHGDCLALSAPGEQGQDRLRI